MFNMEKATFQLCNIPTITSKAAMPANNKILRCAGAVCVVNFEPAAGIWGFRVIMFSR